MTARAFSHRGVEVVGPADDERREREKKRQQALRETFLDLANVFVQVRMRFLRRTGAQPPEEETPKRPS